MLCTCGTAAIVVLRSCTCVWYHIYFLLQVTFSIPGACGDDGDEVNADILTIAHVPQN